MSNFSGIVSPTLQLNTRKSGTLVNGSLERAVSRFGVPSSAISTLATVVDAQPFTFGGLEVGLSAKPLTAVTTADIVVGVKIADTVSGNDIEHNGQVALFNGDRTTYLYVPVTGAIVSGEGLTWDDTTKSYTKTGSGKKDVFTAFETNANTGLKVVIAKSAF